MGFELLEQDIGGNLKENIGDKENGQGSVILRAPETKLILEAED